MVELAARPQRDPERLEIARTDPEEIGRHVEMFALSVEEAGTVVAHDGRAHRGDGFERSASRDRGHLDPGDRLRALANEARQRADLTVARNLVGTGGGAVDSHLRNQHAARAEAGIDIEQADEVPQHQHARDHHDARDCHFHCNQQVEQPARPRRCGRRGGAQRLVARRTRDRNPLDDREHERDGHRQRDRVDGDLAAESHRLARDPGRRQRADQLQACVRERHAYDHPRAGEDHGLGEGVAHEVGIRCADCRANEHVGLPCLEARQHEARGVRGDNREHQRGRSRKQHERALQRRRHHVVAQRHDPERRGRRPLGVKLPLGLGVELRDRVACLFERHSWPQPTDRVKHQVSI